MDWDRVLSLAYRIAGPCRWRMGCVSDVRQVMRSHAGEVPPALIGLFIHRHQDTAIGRALLLWPLQWGFETASLYGLRSGEQADGSFFNQPRVRSGRTHLMSPTSTAISRWRWICAVMVPDSHRSFVPERLDKWPAPLSVVAPRFSNLAGIPHSMGISPSVDLSREAWPDTRRRPRWPNG